MAISTPGVIVTRFAGALYNQQLSNSTYSEVLTAYKTVAELNTLANALVAADFGTQTDLAIATTIVTNLGMSSIAGLSNYVAGQLTAGGAANKGATIISLLNSFSQMTADATYGTYAAAFNTKVDNAQALSQTSGNTGTTFTAAGTAGKPFTLTTGVDTFVGTVGDDTFNGQYGGTGSTLGGLDSIDGGTGNNTLNINDVAGGTQALVGVTVKNVQTINLASAGAAAIDTTGTNGESVTGATTVNVTQGTTATVTAATTTAVNIAGITGAATVTGGSTQSVTAVGAVTLSKAAGAITVTDTKQGASAIGIDGGTSVTVTTTATNPAGTTGTTKVGATTKPTGAVSITENLTNAAAAAGAADTTGGAIAVTGGSTVSVTQTATQAVKTTNSTNASINQSAVTVTGGTATTAVTVNQAAKTTAVATVVAVTGVSEVDSVQFSALTVGQTVTLAGLTVTAPTGGLTAKQVAAAFANLADGQLTGWTSGAVTSSTGTAADTVTFTATSSATTTLTNGGTGTATISQKTANVAAVTAVTGVGGVVSGAVTIADAGASPNTITNVTLSNYGASTIASDVLSTLSLSNSSTAGATGAVTITNTKATTLDLTVNGGGTKGGLGAVTAPTYTTLNIHTTGTDTTASVTAAAVTALKVDGTNALDLTGSTLGVLKTVTVSGAAGLTGTFTAASTTAIDASGTSGNNKITMDPTVATYTGGTGNDTVTIAAAPTKAISGGSGSGTDTLVVNIAGGFTPTGNAYISGFETLGLGALANAGGNYDATGFTALTEGAVAGNVTFTNVAAGAGLTITASPTANTTYTLKDATGTSDSLSLTMKAAGVIAGGTVTASGIESISVEATDSTAAVKAGVTADSVTLSDTSATSVTLTGNTKLSLTTVTLSSGVSKLTSVDASGMTGGLVYTTEGGVAVTVKGGATANTLTAGTGTKADTLIGGAAADTLTANAGLDTLTGGSGADTFVVQTAGANVNTYSTITDAAAGDTLKLADKGTETFTSTKVALAGTAVFQDFANAVVAAGGDASTNGAIGWFQFNGDTYVVESQHNGTTTPSFVNGTDLIVKLTGLVDLSTATLANIAAAPQLAIH